MDFELHVVRGRSTAQVLKLADGVNTVGRHDECQIRIKSSQVSRKHCELFEKKGLLLVKDLGSANGTLVNGKKVNGQQVLEPGDELTIGGIKLRVAKAGVAPPLKEPAPKSASDTAVAEAIPVAETADDDEFEIEFDDDVVSADVEDAIELALAGDEGASPAPAKAAAPAPAPAPAEPAKAQEAKKPAEPAKAAPEPEPAAEADEAIADFLLDLKIDEDE